MTKKKLRRQKVRAEDALESALGSLVWARDRIYRLEVEVVTLRGRLAEGPEKSADCGCEVGTCREERDDEAAFRACPEEPECPKDRGPNRYTGFVPI